MRRMFPRIAILTALLLTAPTALTDSTDFDFEACMAPFSDAKAAATDRYTKALYAGDFGRADHAEETMTILRELRETELAFDGGNAFGASFVVGNRPLEDTYAGFL